MRTHLIGLFTALLASPMAHSNQQNFNEVFSDISDTRWQGVFHVRAKAGPHGFIRVKCDGPIVLKFFPLSAGDLPGEAPTVSYRHDADFSKNPNLLCRTLGKTMSVVREGQCENFPRKFSPEENKDVSYRTLISRGDGTKAVVSSPACRKGLVKRDELRLSRAVLNEDKSHLQITIKLEAKVLQADLTYELNRVD